MPLDHIIWATTTPKKDAEWIASWSGVRPVTGGVHAGHGTRNDLVGLANAACYVEILYPDPAQSHDNNLASPLTRLTKAGLYHWAVRHSNLAEIETKAIQYGLKTSGIIPLSRRKPDGSPLRWQMLFLHTHGLGALVPFFINWGDSPHPAITLPTSGIISHFALQTPHVQALQKLFQAIGLAFPIMAANENGFAVEITRRQKKILLPVASPFGEGLFIESKSAN